MGEGRINVAIAVSGVLALRRSTMAAFCFGNTTLLKSLWAGFFRRAPRAEPEHRDLSAALAMREAGIRASMGEIAAAIALCKEVLGHDRNHHAARLLWAQLELPGEHYLKLLTRLHHHLQPASYLEVGVFKGASLRLPLPDTRVIGVDPAPQLDGAADSNTRVYKLTSDDFFSQHDVHAEFGGRPVELAFIDGMHSFDTALRDFIQIERLATPASTILIHDCYPQDRITAQRERVTTFWSGDVWRLILVLQKYRPGLKVFTIGSWPTGLGLVRNLDPHSRVLGDRYDEIVTEFMAYDYSEIEDHKARMLNLIPNDWDQISALLD